MGDMDNFTTFVLFLCLCGRYFARPLLVFAKDDLMVSNSRHVGSPSAWAFHMSEHFLSKFCMALGRYEENHQVVFSM